MKKVLLPVMIALIVGISCKKQENAPVDNSYTVEYRIDPISAYFTSITYREANGNLVEITDFAQMTDGKRSVKVTAKPFHANLTTVVTNTENTPVYFNLQIWVNGELKAYTAASSPPNSTSTTPLQFTVN